MSRALRLEAEKLDNYAAFITDLEARAEVRKVEAKRLADQAKVDAGRASFLKERLKQHFMRHGKKTIETRRYRIHTPVTAAYFPWRSTQTPRTYPALPHRGTPLQG